MTPDDPRHGTLTGYTNKACRCPECREAHTLYYKNKRRERDGNVPEGVSHGTNATYCGYMCRCRPCKDAHNAYQRQYRKNKKQ